MAKYIFEHPKGECKTCPMYDYDSGNGWSDPFFICQLMKGKGRNIHNPIEKEECPLVEE